MPLATSKPTQPSPSTQASAQAWCASDAARRVEHQIARDVTSRDPEGAGRGDENVGVVLAYALAVGQRLGRAGARVGGARDILDPIAHGPDQVMQPRERVRAAARRPRARGWPHRAASSPFP